MTPVVRMTATWDRIVHFVRCRSGNPEPRVALLRHDGQLDRYLDLQDDLEPLQFQHADAEAQQSRSPQPQSLFEARSIATAIVMSRIVPDGRDLLLVRSGTDRPVFRISPGGEVHSLRIQAPEQAVLTGAFASQDRLVGLYTRRRADGLGSDFFIYAFDRTSGKPLAKYVYPREWGFALDCSGDDFSSLRIKNGKVGLLTASK